MVHSETGTYVDYIPNVQYPEAVEVHSEKVYVGCKTEYGSVVVYDYNGEKLFNFGNDIDVATKGLCVDGDIYVADWKNNKVIKYDSTGAFIAQFGGNLDGNYGSGKGEMHEPTALTKIGDKLYVLEKSNHRLQIFKP
jgi:tripartite motif-containing protein 71